MGSCISTNTYEHSDEVPRSTLYRDDRTNDEMTLEEARDRQARQMIESMKRGNGFG